MVNYSNLTLEEIQEKIDSNRKNLDKIWEEDDGSSWDNYCAKCKPYWDDSLALRTAYVLKIDKNDIKFEPMNDVDRKCLMTIKEFKSCCKMDAITSWDGDGCYATKDETTDLPAEPEAFKQGYIRKDFKYVCWYNK